MTCTGVPFGPRRRLTASSMLMPRASSPSIRLMTSPARMPSRCAGVPSNGETTVMLPSIDCTVMPEAVVLALLALLHRLVVLLLEEVRVGIQRAEHLPDRAGDQPVARDVLDVLALDRAHHRGVEAHLLAQAAPAGLRAAAEQATGQRRSDEKTNGDRTEPRELHETIIAGHSPVRIATGRATVEAVRRHRQPGGARGGGTPSFQRKLATSRRPGWRYSPGEG